MQGTIPTNPVDSLTPFEKISAVQDEQLPDDPNAKDKGEDYENFFTFQKAKPYLTTLINDFKKIKEIAKANRERRKLDVNTKEEIAAGRIKPSDLIIPMRVIDEAIAREKPQLMGYLQQSRRLVIFSDVKHPADKHDQLENAFTRGMQYKGWINAHTKVIDGAQLHGWDWSETLYDKSKPLACSVEHVGFDRLIFPLGSEDIQCSARIMREYNWTKNQFTKAVKDNAFVKDQVDKCLAFNSQTGTEAPAQKDRTFTVYKLYFKWEEIVYVGWFSLEACDDWLQVPKKLYNGVDKAVQVPVEPDPMQIMEASVAGIPLPPTYTTQWVPVEETEYPVNLYLYETTEQEEIVATQGRAFKDKYKQEAMTAGWSSFMNGHNRATWIMGAKAEADGKPANQVQNIEIKDGAIVPFNVAWKTMPYPDPSMLQALTALDVKNAASQGQMTYVTQNKSSGARTTKAEVESAEQTEAEQGSVNITNFADYVRQTYDRGWKIVQSQAMQDTVPLYGQVVEEPANPTTESVDSDSEDLFINDKAIVGRKYEVKPAGDVDYVARRELLADMQEYWPVVSGTPIAMDFLAYMLKTKFGEIGDAWSAKLLAGDPMQLLATCQQILTGLLANPAEAMAMTPEDKLNLQNLIMAIQQTITNVTQPSNANAKSSGANGQQQQSGSGTSKPGESSVVQQSPNPSGV